MKNKLLLFIITMVFTIVVAGCGSSSGGNEKNEGNDAGSITSVIIGTPDSGSTMNTLGIGFSELLHRNLNLNSNVEAIGGGEASLFQMNSGDVDFAFVNSTAAANAYAGIEPFTEPVNVNLFATSSTTFRQIVVRKTSGVESVEDLVGKTLMGIRPGLEEIEELTNALLEVHGIDKGDLKIVSNSTSSETMDGLRVGTVDAAIFPGSLNNPNLTELFQEGIVEYLHIEENKIDEMLEVLPKGMKKDIIPAGHYPNQDETRDVVQLGLSPVMVVSGNLPEEFVYEVVKSFYKNHDEFSSIHSLGADFNVENTLADIPPFPIHTGVKRYFEEIDVWDDKYDVDSQH